MTAGPRAAEDYPRLVRAQDGRILAGVCTGLGRHVNVDPVVLRVGFAVLVLSGGQGLLLYLAAYLLMPSAAERPAPAEQLLKRRFDAGTVLALLGVLLCLATLTLTAGRWFSGGALAGVTVFALVLLVAHARKVDFAQVARSMPERLQGHPMEPATPFPGAATGPIFPGQTPQPDADGPVFLGKTPPPGAGGPISSEDASPSDAGGPVFLGKTPPPGAGAPLPEGMIDLAELSDRYRRGGPPQDVPAPPAGKPERGCGGHRPKPMLTSLTLLGAMAAGAAMIPVAVNGGYGPYGVSLVLAPALAVIGLGLLVGGWFGRARGLATVGTLLTFSLLTTTVVAEAPPDTKFGDVEWRPADASRTEQTYRLGAGDGKLDLTALPLAPGRRIRINAELTVGTLKITVPDAARVEIDGRVGLGDLTVEGRISGGPRAKVVEVLEPQARGTANPPVIELRVRARVGDVEVLRG
ncbi:Phage shock protein PspC (stress-responsive transcriptional regulator) [Thermomonospora echinospora]|uniref:Phage shock protein PspC (Stress-responsive transcriptional regulator) n=2 Tax=Thermomonospora echinospora TaxID=1992 RepID=A0A1H5ZE72_9ACTN|nr:Phage shock protein PspC (stress-responsive transcriptional regulator) [Thermomonospora echinospora]